MTSLDIGGEKTEQNKWEKQHRQKIIIIKITQNKNTNTTNAVNRLGDEGAKSIGEALKANASLTSLCIKGEKAEKVTTK